ncbi:UPF0182 family protein [Candidatus Aquicultor secundus]|uniref:UPF0182 family membrane protein n=1 Tax=Candidatus Aquicultor secundus TaxID=1973895 RepID=UPI000A830314|nr:UPF0182 family protein [Candidatus Aquicultor secundus]
MNTSRIKLITFFAFVVVFLLATFSKSLVVLYTDWLWFKEVGYTSVFLDILKLKFTIGAIAGFVFFVFLYINMLIAKRMAPVFPMWRGSPDDPLYQILRFFKSPMFMRFFNLILLAVAAVVAFGVGVLASADWNLVLRFMNQTAFGIKDPVFSRDIAFHVFSVPFYKGIIGIGFQALILAVILTALVHWINGNISFRPGGKTFAPRTKAHLSVLLGLIMILLGISFKLSSYDLLLSSVGVVFGAGYTDIHAKLPALNILFYSSIIAGIMFMVNIHFKGWKLPAAGILFIIAVSIVANGVYPALVQQYSVSPNEIVKETPYIKQGIKFTNRAYGLDTIKEQQFNADQGLDRSGLDRNKQTIDNVRLWDWQPLGKTYKQIQSIRLYYDFSDVDIDRYLIDGDRRQVAISARELNTDNLPDNAKTWLNQHLVYTHGYGVVANKVNEFTEEGLPKLIVKDIPPKTDIPVLKVTRPEIYFGEATNDYIIVDTKTREFDYPKGNENQYAKYAGAGGITLDSLGKKLATAWRFGDLQLLLSDSLTDKSRVVFNRNIIERAQLIAPFLEYEGDPYIVIDNGRLYWMLDAFTTDNHYPYSHPYDEAGNNYIRNSVKVVIDAYNGDTNYYVFDKKDPIIRTYEKAFPKLFKDGSQMPAGLMAHIRYPESLFSIQSNMFATFHMNDPQVFYNKEDLWNISKEAVDGEQKSIAPYYMEMRLPGEDKTTYLIMNTFTPGTKNNMISWMAVNCDPKQYGQMLVYMFPKQKLIYGPMQIEARIDQTPDISQELTLWSQKGSRVVRGNIFVIPIENSILYVEPLYLQSDQTELPELKRVIVSYGSKIVMKEDLGSALDAIFGQGNEPGQDEGNNQGTSATGTVNAPSTAAIPGSVKDLVNQASRLFADAQQKQRNGDWAGYGDDMKRLDKVLTELKQKTGK